MSRFYVGQRVRIARRTEDCDLMTGAKYPGVNLRVGLEGTILGTESEPNAGFTFHRYVTVVSLHVDEFGVHGMVPESILEPLVPPHEACEAEFKASLDSLLAGVEVEA